MKPKTRMILTSSLAILGLAMTSTGVYLEMTSMTKDSIMEENRNNDIPLEEKLELTLKELTLPLNSSLSMDIQNYIEEPVENKILQSLILDTSKVDTTKIGTYTYTITYQDQTFSGTIIVEETVTQEETQPQTENTKLTLKTISLKLGEEVSKDVSYYVTETLTEEMKGQAKLDLSNVVVNKAGSYQYSISYNGMYYTGTITIVEDQPTVSTPKEDSKNQEEESNEPADNSNETNEQ